MRGDNNTIAYAFVVVRISADWLVCNQMNVVNVNGNNFIWDKNLLSALLVLPFFMGVNIYIYEKACPSRSTSFRLIHYILVDSSIVLCWKSPFVILGVSGLFCRFFISDGKSVSKHCRP